MRLRALALPALLALAAAAFAYLPGVDPVARATADAARAQGRARTLVFDVTARSSGAGGVLAQGRLLTDPSGVARLELRHLDEFVERQLRRASGLEATRDGAPLPDARPLTPPFWLLQAASGGTLLAELAELGGDPAAIALGHDGPHDCYVLGGKGGASVWVDMETYQIARIDLADGTHYRFGAYLASPGPLIVPSRVDVESGALSLVLELSQPAPAKPAPSAFSPAWLQGGAPG